MTCILLLLVSCKNQEDQVVAVAIEQVTGIQLTVNSSFCTISWDSLDNVDGYEIMIRSPGEEDKFQTCLSNKTALNYVPGTSYQVRGFKDYGGTPAYGDFSNVVSS